MDALRHVIRHDSVLQKKLDECKCDRHKEFKHAMKEAEPEDQVNQSFQEPVQKPVMFEELLKLNPRDLIQATYCDAVHEPSLRSKTTDEKNPRMTPWKCWNRDDKKKLNKETGFPAGKPLCNNCGIDKKLRLNECSVLSTYDKKIKIKEWRMGARAVNDKGEVERTQIELLESDLPVNEVLFRLRPSFLLLQVCPASTSARPT